MSSYSGWACFDLLPGFEPRDFVAEVRGRLGSEGESAWVLVRGPRVFVQCPSTPIQLDLRGADLVPGAAARAVIASDFDADGVINRVVGADGGVVHQAAIDEQEHGIPEADDAGSRRAAAALYGVDPVALDRVSATWRADGAEPSGLGSPYLQWWQALGVPWPGREFTEGARPIAEV